MIEKTSHQQKGERSRTRETIDTTINVILPHKNATGELAMDNSLRNSCHDQMAI